MKGLGISKHHAWARFESVQAHYSLAARELEREIIPLLADQHLSLLVWSPLAGGLLTDKFAGGAHPEGARRTTFDFPPVDKERAFKCIDVMKEIAPRYDADVARIALAWLLHQRTVTSVIIGTKTLEQLEDDLKAAEIQLSPEDLKRLDEVSAIRPEYPAWMRR
jgi:aryl-alcohol dehydrogenase-like predicted oxidoreductase